MAKPKVPVVFNETPKHIAAFYYYCTMKNRTLKGLADDMGISPNTACIWSKSFNWAERVKKFDKDAVVALRGLVLEDWAKTKAHLLRVLMEQVNAGVDAGIKPTSTKEIVAAIREIRNLMGEDDHTKDDRNEVIVYTRTITNDETGSGNTDI